jgi:hypothetical protein
MRPGSCDDAVRLGRRVTQPCAETSEVLNRFAHRARHPRRHFDHRLKELGLDAPLFLVLLPHDLENLVDPRDELEALGVQELKLLLDPEAERWALAVTMFQGSSGRSRS